MTPYREPRPPTLTERDYFERHVLRAIVQMPGKTCADLMQRWAVYLQAMTQAPRSFS